MPGVSYPLSVFSRDKTEAAFVFRVDAAVSDCGNRIMAPEENFSLIVRQRDSHGRYLRKLGFKQVGKQCEQD